MRNGKSDFRKNFLTKASIKAQQKKARQQYTPENGDLSGTPLASLCLGINYIMKELERRGKPIHDFDNKTKVVRQIQILGDKVYFLAEEESRDEKREAEKEYQDI